MKFTERAASFQIVSHMLSQMCLMPLSWFLALNARPPGVLACETDETFPEPAVWM